ncbi:capsule assembly Wzi family protein [Mucilaginibacter corticis]|uniref:Capsule assembly Wzi family protein n=1 Tax=Mucilaginibacter corticis TaxID=2597670 RepID=A0A556MKA9_9SPHI|nr:capsule assembly Wzi family protein [Mucilaginibacter corticis]TSJ40309.1 capsule assembly Wzi family protein [Mucilaginibacter corticis]
MKKIFFVFNTILVFACVFLASKTYAQSVPVGMPVLDDYYRRMQLLNKVDSNLSFSVRPLLSKEGLNAKDIFDPDSSLKKDHWVASSQVLFGKGKGQFQILPISWQQQFNSDHPYGWNDGAMIPARGYQTMVSGGFFVRYGPLSIQFKPEYVYAANTGFTGYAEGHSDADLYRYYASHNFVDWPERYGNSVYNKAFWGQSSIRLTFGPMSIGLSNENLWWGPGIQNALILTNNAAGFKHITINTVKPVKTYFGDFEGQIIAGHLDNSAYPPLLITKLSDGTNLLTQKRDDWRYFTGFNINYQPKWVSGFTLGIIRTFDAYYNDVKQGGFSSYVPFFISYIKKDVNNGIGDLFPRDQITSLYARWLFTKAQAEIYIEYGWEDNLYDLADFLQTPEHSRAYVFGLRKFLPINNNVDQHILVSTEITQTSQHTEHFIRDVGLWYANYQLLQGHTNNGQTLGAGTGTGGNIQSVDISWITGLKKVGIQFERYEHDADFAESYLPPINGNSRNWVDFAFDLHGEWNYKNLLFNIKLQEIKSLNYEWILKDYNPDQYYIPHNDVYNFHGELGITYRF